MKPSSLKSSLLSVALVAALGAGSLVAPAFAAGKAGGGGTGGGGVKDVAGTLVSLSNAGQSYNGKLPQGTATLGYAADGSAQSMAFSLNSINVPDGSVLLVRVIMGRLETIFTYYQITHVVYTEVDGSITVSHGAATLTLSKLNGDAVPNFPGPSAAGTTEISILSPDGAFRLLDGVSGSFHA